jgi:undecaprenyl-diphosphatase
MIDWIESLVLGVVQGLTEFLPISSDGHLIVTQLGFEHFTGKKTSAADKIFFDVMLHVGTLMAIILSYRNQVAAGAKGLLDELAEVSPPFKRPAVIRTGVLAVIATLPLIPDKLFFMKFIEQTFDSLTYAGVGFLITAAILLLNLRLKGGEKDAAQTTWLDALLIGIAQMFAPLPGVSRSGLTISAALALGFSKTWAVNFSLMMAVPAILGATVFELRKVDTSTLTGEHVAQIFVSASVAGIIGYLAIVWLLRLVRSGRLWYFSVYLVVLGVSVIAFDQTSKPKGRTDARQSQALDGSDRQFALEPGDRPGLVRAFEPLAGPLAARQGADRSEPVAPLERRRAAESLDRERRLAGSRL